MPFVNIDARGQRRNRAAVSEIQKRHGADERKAAAEARRQRKAAKRASPGLISFFPWPVDGVCQRDPDGAYVQGPNGSGNYQVVVVGVPKGLPEVYCAAVSQWVGLGLKVFAAEPMLRPEPDDNPERGFISIVLTQVAPID